MAKESSSPTTYFHQKTFGQNIRLDNNSLRATRNTSFDHGITFTNKQIKINERIHMKIVDIDQSGQWLGSLAIGFIQTNPDNIQSRDLCKSAIPSICQKTVVSYVKRIFDKLTRNTVITFYYNQEGAFYMLDGKEQDICKNIDFNSPMWGVIDLYGNVKSAILVGPPNTIADSRAFFIKYNQQPDQLPLQYFTKVNPANLQPVTFHEVHGTELDLYCQNAVVFRKNVRKLSRPYIFLDFPMKSGDEFYIRILSLDFNYRTPGVIGFTTAQPSDILNHFERLPADDPMALCDRPEFWVLNEDAFDETLNELDEYHFSYEKNGDISMSHNNGSKSPTKTIACGDPSRPFYPFFFLNGRIMSFSLIGPISVTRMKPTAPDPKDDAGLCQLCLDSPANCVMIPCGHIFFCSDCRTDFEAKFKNNCPICRLDYTDVIEIQND
ncbi:unnamed protein product [Rotaria magnacalcarata]|uniref:RING-type domain-containing protein n=2 Tax=Rotaria magnacalcarata TaxID=392030 RepID=A0A816K2H8_9BILA|nr:unnamed protein product [Rotaria magnacalcarata]CAF1251997.1 unnamed protein product [Rotaria magnacalcarata]CAF1904902.1 unnamed protein product [Rotaria magnacalcarata]CAF4145623.1 unnamed protein product [Rotaria magnacalcarata]